MRRLGLLRMVLLLTLLASAAAPLAHASTVTITGSVSYSGPYQGDTLYVAVLDTNQTGHDQFLDLKAYSVGAPPLNQAYSLSFDNTSAPSEVIVAALLDVDGGGADSVSANDILGWYASTATPTALASSTSHSNIDFSLPEGEIQGMLTFAPGQTYAYIVVSQSCSGGVFSRPAAEFTHTGPYAMRGVYPGLWCVFAFGFIPPFTFTAICYGDPTCENPTLLSITGSETLTNIDLDFSGNVPAGNTTWGRLKSKY
jgi:hypothetical protein